MPQSYTPEFKKKIVRLHEEEGRTYKSITAEYGVSKASISKWCSEFSKECQSSPEAKEDYDNMKEMLRLKRENEELLKATAEARTLMEQLPEDTSYVDADHAQIVNDARTAYDKLDKNGKVIDSTAFDSAISGVEFTGGTGVDGDGDPTNIVSIMLRLSEIFKDYNEEGNTWGAAGDAEDAQRLVDKLTKAQDNLSAQHTSLDTQVKFLQTNQTQLSSSFTALNTELNSIEQIDQVEAILTLVSAQTSYNAAIQVGANIVPQSLMDYLN